MLAQGSLIWIFIVFSVPEALGTMILVFLYRGLNHGVCCSGLGASSPALKIDPDSGHPVVPLRCH